MTGNLTLRRQEYVISTSQKTLFSASHLDKINILKVLTFFKIKTFSLQTIKS